MPDVVAVVIGPLQPTGTSTADALAAPQAGTLVLRGGLIRVAGFGAGTLLSLGTVAVLTRHLGVRDYGRYQTIASIVQIVQVMADLGIGAYGLRELSHRRGNDRDDFIRALLGLRLVLTTAALAIVALALLLGGRAELAVGTILMGAGLVVLLAQMTYALPWAVSLRLATVTALDVGRQVLVTLSVVLLVLAGSGFLPILAAGIPAQIVVLLVTGALVRGQVPLRPAFGFARFKPVLMPALTIAAATTAAMAYLYAAQLLTAAVASPHDTGIFSLGFRVFFVLASVAIVIAGAAFPLLAHLARTDRARLSRAVRKLGEWMLVLGAGAAVSLFAGAEVIVAIVGGGTYEDAVGVLHVQAVVLAVTFILPVMAFGLLALERHRAMALANVVAIAVIAICIPVLIAAAGARGAAWAQLLAELVLACGYAAALSRHTEVMRPSGILAVKVVAAAALGIAGSLAAGGVSSLAGAVVAPLVYAAATIGLQTLPLRSLRTMSLEAP